MGEQELPLPRRLAKKHWKVRVYHNERLEPPHVTILWKYRKWRLGLRDGAFLEAGDQWGDIDPELRAFIEANWSQLQEKCDRFHPANPVQPKQDDDGSDQPAR